MKKLIFILSILIIGCNSEDAPNCLQTEGDITETSFEVSPFVKVRIEDDVSLEIRQGPQDVLVRSGINLISDVMVTVEDSTLVVRNNNHCNLFRDYETVTAIVSVPNLREIRNSSQGDIWSEGTLIFPDIRLISNTTGNIEGTRKSGDFTLDIQSEVLVVEANGYSAFHISGQTRDAVLSFEDEVPFFQGRNLQIDHLRLFQRSANKMIVKPMESIRGEIRGVGDVISVHRPPIVEVEEFYSGQLIFED